MASPQPEAVRDLARPICGAPLLVRQLEWLRKAGATRVTINRVAGEPLPAALRASELRNTGVEVVWIPSDRPLGVGELLARAEASPGVAIVLLHGRLGSIDLRRGWQLAVETGDSVVMACGELSAFARHATDPLRQPRLLQLEGWLLDVTSEHAAQQLSERVLSEECTGIEIRGSKIAPGVWRARGALAVEGSTLRPPCYLGRGSLVAEGALLGPGGILGEHAILEEGAEVVHGRVDDHVVIGQGVVVDHACALDGRMVRHGGRQIEIQDSLLMGRTGRGGLATRLAAAAALLVVAPAGALLNGRARVLARRLERVAQGSARWVGARDDADEDAAVIDVLALLVPPGAGDDEKRAARAIYARNKNAILDTKLVAAWLIGSARSSGGT
ncbi:MAG: hypothetical protein HY898_17450 [Deltaproteobacteria bacterium]|nr:hypothetical protein [Deltaproteobacteria bacterium]